MTDAPNVLWLVIDCGRADRLSGHGHHRPTTPFLDRLAAEGVDYTHAVSPAIWSLPAYTSLLTGLYPRQHGVNRAGQALAPDTPTVAHALRRAGYETACFSNNGWLNQAFGTRTGFDRFDPMWYAAQQGVAQRAEYLADIALGLIRRDRDKGARRTNRRLERWLNREDLGAWFAFVAYIEPHTPYSEHRALRRQLAPGSAARERAWSAPAMRRVGVRHAYDWAASLPERHVYEDDYLEAVSVRYDLEMRYLDGQIERLFDRLRRQGRLDNTIVVVTADHGELLGEHGMMGHQCSVAEPLRRVPLLVWGPGHVPAGRVVTDVVQTVDLAPAIAGWTGAEWEPHALTCPLPTHDGDAGRTVAYTDYAEPSYADIAKHFPDVDITPVTEGLVCASDARFKVVRRGADAWVGYDLADDPSETTPLAMDAHPAFAGLRDALLAYDALAEPPAREPVALPADIRKHLQALGYVE